MLQLRQRRLWRTCDDTLRVGMVARARTRNVRSRATLTAVLVWLVAAASATAQDSEAPPGASQRWLPCERWVMEHWLPYDERRMFRMLRLTREEARVWISDDLHHSFAQLVRRRGLTLDVAVDRLVVPWTRGLGGVRRNVLRARAMSTLAQSHLSQHVLFHEFHHPAVGAEAWQVSQYVADAVSEASARRLLARRDRRPRRTATTSDRARHRRRLAGVCTYRRPDCMKLRRPDSPSIRCRDWLATSTRPSKLGGLGRHRRPSCRLQSRDSDSSAPFSPDASGPRSQRTTASGRDRPGCSCPCSPR